LLARVQLEVLMQQIDPKSVQSPMFFKNGPELLETIMVAWTEWEKIVDVWNCCVIHVHTITFKNFTVEFGGPSISAGIVMLPIRPFFPFAISASSFWVDEILWARCNFVANRFLTIDQLVQSGCRMALGAFEEMAVDVHGEAEAQHDDSRVNPWLCSRLANSLTAAGPGVFDGFFTAEGSQNFKKGWNLIETSFDNPFVGEEDFNIFYRLRVALSKRRDRHRNSRSSREE
jgi:hypothetical protein